MHAPTLYTYYKSHGKRWREGEIQTLVGTGVGWAHIIGMPQRLTGWTWVKSGWMCFAPKIREPVYIRATTIHYSKQYTLPNTTWPTRSGLPPSVRLPDAYSPPSPESWKSRNPTLCWRNEAGKWNPVTQVQYIKSDFFRESGYKGGQIPLLLALSPLSIIIIGVYTPLLLEKYTLSEKKMHFSSWIISIVTLFFMWPTSSSLYLDYNPLPCVYVCTLLSL